MPSPERTRAGPGASTLRCRYPSAAHAPSSALQAADVIVTMGCGDAAPTVPGRRYENWELDDPSGKDLPAVRLIRDEIESRVRWLLDDLRIPVRP